MERAVPNLPVLNYDVLIHVMRVAPSWTEIWTLMNTCKILRFAGSPTFSDARLIFALPPTRLQTGPSLKTSL